MKYIFRLFPAIIYDYIWLVPAVIGLSLIGIIPPFQSPDEQTHFYRAYQLSEGHLLGKKLHYGAGDVLPASLSSSFDQHRYLIFDTNAKISKKQLFENLHQPLQPSKRIETRFENTMIYPPASYLPQTFVIFFGKLLGLGPVILLYLARFASWAAWVSILGFLMRRHSGFRLPLFVFSMLPMVLFLSASASADMLTIALALVVTLEIIRTLLHPDENQDFRPLFIFAALLSFAKFPYSLILLLGLIIPVRQFQSKKQAIITKLYLLTAVAISLIWVWLANKTFVNLREGTETATQLGLIIHQPLHYSLVLFNTLFGSYGYALLLQFVGVLGWLDTKIPFLMTFIYVVALVASITISNSYLQRAKTSKLLRLSSFAMFIVLVIVIATSLYLTWCSPGAPVVDGLQGRYFLPLFGLLISSFTSIFTLTKNKYNVFTYTLYTSLSLCGLATLAIVISRYYA